MSDVAQLMRAANPVPDSEAALPEDEFDALLLLTQSRSGNMDVQELTKPVEPDRKPRGWMLAVAAAAVVIAIFGGVILSSRSTDAPPATPPPTSQAVTPTTVAEAEAPPSTLADLETTTTTLTPLDAASVAFLDELAGAVNVGEVEAVAAKLMDAGTVVISDSESESPNDPRTELVNFVELWALLESEVTIDGCRTLSSGVTRCDMARTSSLEPHSPLPETSVVQVRVEGDHVAFFWFDWRWQDPWADDLTAFHDWLCVESPAACQSILFVPDPEQAAEAMKEYVPLWRATLDE